MTTFQIHWAKWKNLDWNDSIVYVFIYMTFWKKQIHKDRSLISCAQGLKVGAWAKYLGWWKYGYMTVGLQKHIELNT